MRVFLCLGLHIGNVVRASLYDSSTVEMATHERYLVLPDGAREWYVPVMRDETQGAAVHLKNRRVESIAQASGTRRYLCEHVLQVHWRARDHPQDLRGGGLLLSCLG